MEFKLNNLLFLKRFYNLSNKKMAEILEIRPRQYSNIENGTSKLDHEKMALIAQTFKVEIQELYFEDLEKKAHDWFKCQLQKHPTFDKVGEGF
jgi:transcriptional regulator with XRE-family HTH domain